MHMSFSLESLKDSDHLEDLVEDEMIVPEFILEKQGRIFKLHFNIIVLSMPTSL